MEDDLSSRCRPSSGQPRAVVSGMSEQIGSHVGKGTDSYFG